MGRWRLESLAAVGLCVGVGWLSAGCLSASEITESASKTALDAGEAARDSNSAAISALMDRVSQLEEDLEAAEESLEAAEEGLERLDAHCIIDEDTTVTVASSGADHPNPWEAVERAHHCSIRPDVTLTIEIRPGTYEGTNRLEFHHPDGDRLIVRGGEDTVLEFDGAGGILIGGGTSVREITGLTLVGKGTQSDGFAGVWVNGGGTTSIGDLEISGFGGHGVRASFNSTILQAGSERTLDIRDVRLNGVRATFGSVIRVPDSTTIADIDGFGVFADAAVIRADGAKIDNAALGGLYATRAGVILANGVDITVDFDGSGTRDARMGAEANLGSFIDMGGASSVSGGFHGIYANEGSVIDASEVTVGGTTFDGLFAANNSTMSAELASVTDAWRGAHTQYGAVLYGPSMTIVRPGIDGVLAEFGSTGVISGTEVLEAGEATSGVHSRLNATIVAGDVVVSGAPTGLLSSVGSGIHADGAELTGTEKGIWITRGSWGVERGTTYSGYSDTQVVDSTSFIVP